MTGRRASALVVSCLLWGCRGFPIDVRTPKPLEVNVRMQVDIVQRRVDADATDDAEAAAPTNEAGTSDEEMRRRARMSQIQSFKNSRIVGENRQGLLTIVRQPPGEFGNQVQQTVAAENADRTELMRVEAERRRLPRATIEAEQAAAWRERAFPGEWIEEQQPDKTWRFVQKQARNAPATLAPAAPTTH